MILVAMPPPGMSPWPSPTIQTPSSERTLSVPVHFVGPSDSYVHSPTSFCNHRCSFCGSTFNLLLLHISARQIADGAHFDTSGRGGRNFRSNLDGLVPVRGVDEVKARQGLLRLSERSVGYRYPAVPN